jgi:hypothetical protein
LRAVDEADRAREIRLRPPFADPDGAARKLVEPANTFEPAQNGRRILAKFC